MEETLPQLRVSKPVEDICQYCYAFFNRHRYLLNRAIQHEVMKTMKRVMKATAMTLLYVVLSLKVRIVTIVMRRVLRALFQHHLQATALSI